MTEGGPLSRGVCLMLLLVAAATLVRSAVEIASAYRSRERPTTDAEGTVSTVAYVVGHSVRPYEPQITYTYLSVMASMSATGSGSAHRDFS